MSEKTAVIGFDLGHGETALTIIDDAYSRRGAKGMQPRPVFNVKSQPTVLATLQDKRKVWGFKAWSLAQAKRDQISEFEICFKAKPGWQHTDDLIAEFAACVRGEASVELNGQLDSRAQWFIGCPSAWNDDTRSAYKLVFLRAGFSNVTIVKESRAAFTYYFEKSDGGTIGNLQEPTLVLDFGSSTLDATLAIGLRDEELDPGCPLGASWIDKAILHWNLTHCSRDDFPAGKQDGEKIAAFLLENRFERSRVEMEIRKAKEYYFNNQDSYPDADRSFEPSVIKVGEHRFYIVLHGEMMRELMSTSIEKVVPDLISGAVPVDVQAELVGYSWLGRCEKFLEDIAVKLEAQGIKRTDVRHVLLTGGASRMQPVRQLVRTFFEAGQMLAVANEFEGKVEYDTEPELCIARGLACWGRTAIQGEAFRDEVNTILFGKFTINDASLAEMQAAGVPESVVAKVDSLKSLSEEKCNPEAFHAALATILGKCDYEKHADTIIDKTPLEGHHLYTMMVAQWEIAKFEEIVGDKLAEVALPWLRSWHNANTKSSQLGQKIADDLRKWSESGAMLNLVKSRVERLEVAIRKEINERVRPIMAKYQISDIVFMERTELFDAFVKYYKTDVESLATNIATNAWFEDLSDSWWTRWIDVADADLVHYVRERQRYYSAATLKELYGDEHNRYLLIQMIYAPVKTSIERAIIATQYLISAEMDVRTRQS